MNDVKRTQEPHDRLTRLCAVMTAALDASPERGEEKCIIFLSDSTGSGITLHGYDDDAEPMVDLLFHLRAIFKANGKELTFVPIREPGRG